MKIHGIGTEIVECLRIAQLIERHGERFINRVYTASEIRFCNQRKTVTQQFAAYWVAKEAVLKAMGYDLMKGMNFCDLEIRPNSKGKYIVALQGTAKELLETSGITEIQITLSHCRTHATATAIAMTNDQANDDLLF